MTGLLSSATTSPASARPSNLACSPAPPAHLPIDTPPLTMVLHRPVEPAPPSYRPESSAARNTNRTVLGSRREPRTLVDDASAPAHTLARVRLGPLPALPGNRRRPGLHRVVCLGCALCPTPGVAGRARGAGGHGRRRPGRRRGTTGIRAANPAPVEGRPARAYAGPGRRRGPRLRPRSDRGRGGRRRRGPCPCLLYTSPSPRD